MPHISIYQGLHSAGTICQRPQSADKAADSDKETMSNLGMGSDIGDPMAARELESDTGRILVEIGAPRRMPDNRPARWMCGLRITGLKQEPVVVWAPGEDSMFALIQALRIAGDQLNNAGVHLTHFGSENLMMPTTQPDGNIMIERITEEELAAVLGPADAADLMHKMDSLNKGTE
ncbi:DUF6968 family protein [Nocardia sp. CA-107356]|uniref:DUF6968 family protein n=1 Tax=Nocardia sp. CA-107356 TaxID=3239972 RepID=UPI003D927710